jgi:nucleosome binding factor SPN SPT16 subunit
MADIKIDNKLFQERISHFATAWKNDLRTKDGLFGGASSILIMMGKMEEIPEFHKNNAMHVSWIATCSAYNATRPQEHMLTTGFLFSFGSWATNFRRH